MQTDDEGRPVVSGEDVFEMTNADNGKTIKVRKADVDRIRRVGRQARILFRDGTVMTTDEEYSDVVRVLLSDGETDVDEHVGGDW